jgi:hypothetical protein
MALTLDTFKTSSTKNLTPTPRPQLQESKPEREGVTASRPDQSTLSEEARQGEAAASSNSPVNFAAWDSPAPVEGETKVEGVNNSPAAAKATNALGTATLKKGMRSDEVRALQEMLKSNGADIGVDGIFGKDTLKAVQEFQKSQGLEVDGLVGKDTRKALEGLGATAQDSQAQAQDQPVKAEEATAQAEEAASQAQAEGAQAGESEKADSTIPGTDDTSWTEKLPKGLQPHAQAFIDAGKKYGVDPRFLAAISSQETGGGTSKAIKNKNNAMGIMKGKKLRSFNSVADSINSQARSLTREGGFYTGKDTIANIGGTYAPVGAANDPRGLNKHWIPNITKFYENLGGDPNGKVKGF